MNIKAQSFATIMVGILLLSGTPSVDAEGLSLGLKATTLGAEVDGEYAFNPSFGARVGVRYFTYDYNDDVSDIEYDVDLELLSVSALLDWHPFQGSFRISAGVMYNGNEADATGKPNANGTYQIGDTTYPAAAVGTLDGNIDFNKFAPYVGLGWDTSFGKKKAFGFLFEIGAMFQGSPNVDLTASGPIASDPTFQQNLNQEKQNIEDDIDSFTIYPMIAIGFCYRF